MVGNTIAAIATAASNAGIGVIRISGDDAFSIIDNIFKSKKKEKKLSEEKSHTIHYGHIVDGDEVIDEVLVLIFRGPNSYTAEDTVEIDCHGGSYVMNKILKTVLKNGARPAEPGEFTKRAFLNGRIDLSQAEAVMDLIQSQNDMALRSSVSQLKGAVKDKISHMRSQLIYHIAYIESALDDPEHIDLTGYGDKLYVDVDKLSKELKNLLSTFQNGKMIKEGINTVILGKPNAGKSSLLNVLLGEDRAIVTNIAGTTRDILEQSMNLEGLTLNMIDTAGIRESEDLVEQIGIEKAKQYAEKADLIIYVVDASVPLDESDDSIIELIKHQKSVVLLNKSDLETKVNVELLKDKTKAPLIEISAKHGEGIHRLEDTIKNMFFQGEIAFNDEVYLTNARQEQLVEKAYESLMLVKGSIENGMAEDFYSIDLMDAYENLGAVLGESVEDDLVNEIFSKFCMGK